MRRLYENPPVIEALCEFQFEPSQPWDWTIPGLVYAEVRMEYPKKRHQNVVEVELRAEQQDVIQRVKGGVARMQFLRDDERALIQIGPDLLAVNHLSPYPKWEVFNQMIVQALKIYCQVTSPKALRRIGLRYINRIEIPGQRIKIEDYLLVLPSVPEPMPRALAGWVQRVEIPFESANGVLVLQSGSVPREEQAGVALMLDLDFVTRQAETVTLDSAMAWVERAHDELESAFEACITDKARELLKEVRRDE